MDVTCQRCQTRYEFDDALVSSRGTTVKCTQCGHLFRIHAAAGKEARDAWTVRTAAGAELTFRAMRELQAAITSGRVGRDDVLIGSQGVARRLGDIEELETFFPDRTSVEPDTVRRPRHGSTKLGVPTPAGRPATPPPPPGQLADRDGQPLPTRTGSTLRPPGGNLSEESAPFEVVRSRLPAEHRPESVPPVSQPPEGASLEEETTQKRRSAPPPPSSGELDIPDDRPTLPEPKSSQSTSEAVAAMAEAVNAALSDDDEDTHPATNRPTVPSDEETYDEDPREIPGAIRVSEAPETVSYPPSDGPAISSVPLTPSPSVARPSILGRASAFTDPRFSSFESTGKQPSFARWLIGLVLLGVIAVVGFTLLKRYLPVGDPSTTAPQSDTRVDKFLREAEAKLDAGDIEGAREQLIMATGVTDSDPRVARALALVEIVRADVPWLHLRLLAEDAPNRARIRQQLTDAVERAERAAKRASELDSRAPEAVRLRIDVLRLKGDHTAARNLVKQLGDPGAQAAVVLAGLDLAEAEPSWPSVLDRLQTAVREERKLGRARSMLVYALARAGKVDEAEAELEAFAAGSPRHPLLEPLRAYLKEAPTRQDGGADAGADRAAADGDDEPIPADFRKAIRKAHEARSAGNLDRAEQLYHAALEKSPGNSEALSGLAEVYRGRGNTTQAMAAYQKLLDQNPGYLPALVALADLKWQSGAKSEAVALYRQVVEAAPGSAYADHARSRIEAGKGSSSTSSAKPPATRTPTSEPAPTAPSDPTATTEPSSPPPDSTSDLPPGVDVSDLPEFH